MAPYQKRTQKSIKQLQLKHFSSLKVVLILSVRYSRESNIPSPWSEFELFTT